MGCFLKPKFCLIKEFILKNELVYLLIPLGVSELMYILLCVCVFFVFFFFLLRKRQEKLLYCLKKNVLQEVHTSEAEFLKILSAKSYS